MRDEIRTGTIHGRSDIHGKGDQRGKTNATDSGRYEIDSASLRAARLGSITDLHLAGGIFRFRSSASASTNQDCDLSRGTIKTARSQSAIEETAGADFTNETRHRSTAFNARWTCPRYSTGPGARRDPLSEVA